MPENMSYLDNAIAMYAAEMDGFELADWLREQADEIEESFSNLIEDFETEEGAGTDTSHLH